MAVAKKKKSTRWSDAGTAVEDLGGSERIAHEIVLQYGDLSPSVDRIMNSGLEDDEREKAMTLFQASLGVIGDENRNPAVAIEASRSKAR